MNEYQANVLLLTKALTLPSDESNKIPTPFDILEALDHIRQLLADKREFAQSGHKMYQGVTYNPADDVLLDLQTIYQGHGLSETEAALVVYKYGVIYQMVMRPAIDTLRAIFEGGTDVDDKYISCEIALRQMEAYVRDLDSVNIHPDDARVAKATIFAKVRAKREAEKAAKPVRKRRGRARKEENFDFDDVVEVEVEGSEIGELVFE